MKYKGQVTDRMSEHCSYVLCSTHRKSTYEEAHHAAEVLAKRRQVYDSQRYSINVIEID